MKRKMRMAAASLAMLLLTGCTTPVWAEESGASEAQAILNAAEMFSERDYEADYDEAACARIVLQGDTAQSSSDAAVVSGATVTISAEGTYVLSGTLDQGMVIVNAKNTDKVQLVLDGVTITNEASAAIYVAQADKVVITLATGSVNVLSGGETFTPIDESQIDAVIFSKDDLTLNGQGSLTVQSPAGHGIVSKDDLVITGGEYSVDASGQGLCGKESVRIADGTFSVTAGKDGIHAEDADDASLGFVYLAGGAYEMTSEGDGISASGDMQIDDGVFSIQSGGGSETVTLDAKGDWGWKQPNAPQEEVAQEESISVKGLKAGGNLLVNGGTFDIDSADDALHANGNLTIGGGSLELSSGDDGIHADGTATIQAGTLTIARSYEGIEGQNLVISGGTIDLVASDDGLNAAGGNDQSGDGGFGGFNGNGRGFDAAADSSIRITGGVLRINASGDGVDSNGSLEVSGGETYVAGPTNDGNGSLDYGGEASITGGSFVATGASGMAQSFGASSTQGAMLVSVSGSEGDVIALTDDAGNVLLSYTAEKAFSCVLLSSPEIRQGDTYTLRVGETTQQVQMDSLIQGAGGMDGMRGGKGGMGERPDDNRSQGNMPMAPDGMPENRQSFEENADNEGQL